MAGYGMRVYGMVAYGTGFIFFIVFNTFESLDCANERLCQSIEETVFEYRHHLNEQRLRNGFLKA